MNPSLILELFSRILPTSLIAMHTSHPCRAKKKIHQRVAFGSVSLALQTLVPGPGDGALVQGQRTPYSRQVAYLTCRRTPYVQCSPSVAEPQKTRGQRSVHRRTLAAWRIAHPSQGKLRDPSSGRGKVGIRDQSKGTDAIAIAAEGKAAGVFRNPAPRYCTIPIPIPIPSTTFVSPRPFNSPPSHLLPSRTPTPPAPAPQSSDSKTELQTTASRP